MLNGKLRYSFENENFDLYFANEAKKINEEGKALLPKQLSYKLFRGGGMFMARSTSKLSFFEKIYTLWKALRKKVYVIVQDEENGLSIDDYLRLKSKEQKKSETEITENTLKISTSFFLGSKELCDAFDYLNTISTSPQFAYLLRMKNMPKSGIAEHKKQKYYFMNFLANYEGRKKKMVIESGLTMPEFLVLIYLYDGKDVPSSSIYKNIYKYCYQSSKTKIKVAFGTLQNRGYIVKTGAMSNAKMKITALGRDKLDDVMVRYFIYF